MSERKKKFDVVKCIVWVLTVMLSIGAIFIGNRVAMEHAPIFTTGENQLYKATVTQVLDESSDVQEFGDSASYENRAVYFKCEIEEGTHEGDIVEAEQSISGMYAGSDYVKSVEEGDRVLLVYSEDMGMMGQSAWQFSDYYRFNQILILAAVFLGLILIIGRWKGVNTILSLGFTFAFVFLVFVPAVMSGYNAYLWSVITCVYAIVMTLLLINSVSRKTLATIIGCISGTVIAAVGTCIMSAVMDITGYVDEHSYYLTMLDTQQPIDLVAVIFAAIIIGAVGAIMDIAMDISSSLYELCEHVPDISFVKLCKSGMNIGRDIMGTMANTLVLAYIGSSLSCIMILLTYTTSIMDLLNRELIIVEIMTALLGSLAILLTIPCTVVICGVLYLAGRKKTRG